MSQTSLRIAAPGDGAAFSRLAFTAAEERDTDADRERLQRGQALIAAHIDRHGGCIDPRLYDKSRNGDGYRGDGYAYVCENDGEIIAAMLTHPPGDNLLYAADDAHVADMAKTIAVIDLIAVVPQRRREGHARALIEYFEREAVQRGIRLTLARTFQLEAARFFRRCGYSIHPNADLIGLRTAHGNAYISDQEAGSNLAHKKLLVTV